MKRSSTKIGILVRDYREKYNISQRAMAKEMGIYPMKLSRLENGENPSLGTLLRVLQWLADQDELE